MRSVASLLVCFLAGASALIAGPVAPMQQQLAASRIAATQMMSNTAPARVEIELEDGEP